MHSITRQQAYDLVREFVETVDRRDSVALQEQFGIPAAVTEEMFESIDGYFEAGSRLSVAPPEEAFESHLRPRPFMDTYETHDKTLGLECVLFANGVPGEAILHLEMRAGSDRPTLHYRYIGS